MSTYRGRKEKNPPLQSMAYFPAKELLWFSKDHLKWDVFDENAAIDIDAFVAAWIVGRPWGSFLVVQWTHHVPVSWLKWLSLHRPSFIKLTTKLVPPPVLCKGVIRKASRNGEGSQHKRVARWKDIEDAAVWWCLEEKIAFVFLAPVMLWRKGCSLKVGNIPCNNRRDLFSNFAFGIGLNKICRVLWV